MQIQELTGYYTCRFFLNDPLPIDDFNKIKVAEQEIYMFVQTDGIVIGLLSSPANPTAQERRSVQLSGTTKLEHSRVLIELNGKGSLDASGHQYSFALSCSGSKEENEEISQRLVLCGKMIRKSSELPEDQLEDNQEFYSFLAVQRDFTEPRDIQGVALIPSALKMVSSKSHRLKHAVWHTLRGRIESPENSRNMVLTWYNLDVSSKEKIRQLGWYLDRPPFTSQGSLDLVNGAGEDFLFMHRKMIAMIKNEYQSHGVSYTESWKSGSLPLPNVPQFVYKLPVIVSDQDKQLQELNAQDSGNMVPPFNTTFESELEFMRTPEFFYNVMRHMDRIFSNQRNLSALTLGALGNLIEFTIHGWMHNRWANTAGAYLVDPETNELTYRRTFDFDPMWNDAKYDYLGEFYSSHVNPVFWRLHGWVDDRIDDWFQAHESSHPGEIERYEYDGVAWFKLGKWVKVEKPYYWPETQHSDPHHDGQSHTIHHNHNGNEEEEEIDNMLKVMDIIKASVKPPVVPQSMPEMEETTKEMIATVPIINLPLQLPGGSMNFIHTLESNK
jgi:hypothetical protein